MCVAWLPIKANKINWGKYEGETEIANKINKIYIDTQLEKEHLLPCPVETVVRSSILIYLFVRKTEWERIAITRPRIYSDHAAKAKRQIETKRSLKVSYKET